MKPNEQEIKTAKQILHNLIQSGFKNVEEAKFYAQGYSFEGGCTKLCIFHPALGSWVIKVNRPSTSCDRCSDEYHNYLEAEKEGLAKFFPFTMLLETIDSISYFLQERVKADSNKVHDIWYETIAEAYPSLDEDEIEDYIDDIDDYDSALYLLGDDCADFCSRHYINDLHMFNFGFRDNGEIVCFDFSGF